MAALTIFAMPAHWASYLINGDASGLDDGEIATIEAYLSANGDPRIFDTEGEPYFSWSFGRNGGNADGGDLVDYVVELNDGWPTVTA